jgi:predicted Zn-dependent protease
MDDENRFLKYWIIAGVIVVLALMVFPGRSVYRHLKVKHSVAKAQVFFSKGDYRNAWLSARQALLVNSNNFQACLIMAKLSDAAHSPATLDWCQRVVKLSPAITNKLLLASAGLRYQGPPYPLTSQVLDDLSATAAGVPDFHIVSAELDLSLHRMADAETQFEAACQLEPTNRLFQLNLAVIRLGSTNNASADDARAKLNQFSTDANLGPSALRSLIADRLLHNDASGALNYSTQLLANAQATLNDRLQQLGILKRLQSSALATQLNALQRDAATNAAMAAQTASWMEANGFVSDTVSWLKTLPASIQTQTPVRLAFVDCCLNTTNWQGLRNLTSSGDWGEMDFLRLAFSSHAWSELGEPLMADGHWRSAVSEAGERLGALTALLELANRWQLPRAREDLLWRILRRFPDARWAQDSLERLYFDAGNTAGLYQLSLKQLPRSPQNVGLKNNLAATALLLKTNLTQACQWAAEIYAEAPTNAHVVSTYAYALHLQGRNQEGLAALQKLKPSQLEQRSLALYYGVLLSATGKASEAAPYLQIARTKGQLLPEEKQLLAETDKMNQMK